MKWKILLSIGLVVFIYLTLGGVAFHYLEGEAERDHHIRLENITKQFLDDNRCVSESELDELLRIILVAHDRGIIEFSNKSSASNWDLASALFFSITVVTTIGYGHIFPATGGGQAFCVIYAVLGIPLCLTLLAGIGYKLRQLFRLIDRKLDVCAKQPRLGKTCRVLLILLIGLLCFLLLPAIMFTVMDGWTYAEALYYCFITLTTIGFGDLVPGLENTARNRPLYRIMVGLWIFVGLAWLAGVITFIQELLMALVNQAQTNLGKSDNKHTSAGSIKKCSLGDTSVDGKTESLGMEKQPPAPSSDDEENRILPADERPPRGRGQQKLERSTNI